MNVKTVFLPWKHMEEALIRWFTRLERFTKDPMNLAGKRLEFQCQGT